MKKVWKSIRHLFGKIIYHKDIYFDDNPICKIKNDYIGVSEQCEFLRENISESAGLVGIVSEHGSGKSSIINLLVHQKPFIYKYKIVNLLEDTKDDPSKQVIMKKLLLSVVKEKNYNYYSSLLNSNYRVISVKTRNVLYKYLAIVFGLLLLFGIFNKVIPSLEFLIDSYPNCIKNVFVTLRTYSGLIGFIGLSVISLFSKISYKLPTKGDDNKPTMDDINEYLRNEIAKYDFIVIEELDRLGYEKDGVLIDVINILYNISKDTKTTFIVSILPEQFDKLGGQSAESKLKPFKAVLKIEKTTRENNNKILADLIEEKAKNWKKIGIKVPSEQKITSRGLKTIYDTSKWQWLSKGDNINIRVLKHRLNDVIALYKKIKSRFPEPYSVDINTCIAVVYLKSEYSDFYNYLLECNNLNDIKSQDNWLKTIISSPDKEIGEKFKNYVKNEYSKLRLSYEDSYDKKVNSLIDDIRILKIDHLKYNIELYIYNYPKGSHVYSYIEETVFNCYKDNQKIKIYNDKMIEDILNNSKCIEDAIEFRKIYRDNTIPSNMVYCFPVVKKLYYEILKQDESKGNILAQSLYKLDADNFEDVLLCIDMLKKDNENMYKDIIINNYYDIYSNMYRIGLSEENLHIARKRLLSHLNKDNIKIDKLFPTNESKIQYDELQAAGLANEEGVSLIPDVQLDEIENNDMIKMINNNCIPSSKVFNILRRKNIESRNIIIKNINKADENIVEFVKTNIISFDTDALLHIMNLIDSSDIIEQGIIDDITDENKEEMLKNILEIKNLETKSKLYEYVIDYNNIQYISNRSVLDPRIRDSKLFDMLLDNKIKSIKENGTNDELVEILYSDDELNDYLDYDLKQIIIDKEFYQKKPKNMMILSKQKQTNNSLSFVLNTNEIDTKEYINNRGVKSYHQVDLDDAIIDKFIDKLNLSMLLKYQKLSNNILMKYKDRFNKILNSGVNG